MTHIQHSMLILNLWVIPKNPHDFVSEIDAFFCRFIDTRGLDEFGDGAQCVFRVGDDAVHPCSLAVVEEGVLKATEATGFVDVCGDVTGRFEEVGGLFVDGFELVCDFEDLDGAVDGGTDDGEGVHGCGLA